MPGQSIYGETIQGTPILSEETSDNIEVLCIAFSYMLWPDTHEIHALIYLEDVAGLDMNPNI